MTITSRKVEATPENADKAFARAKALLPVWAPLVRALARNPKLEVRLTADAPSTNGKVVNLRVPLELAFTDHDKMLCGEWDTDNNTPKCPACAVELGCDVNLFHEVAHNVAGTFSYDDPDEELLQLLRDRWPNEASRFDPVALGKPMYGKPKDWDLQDALTHKIGMALRDPFGFITFNVIEDAFVNASIIKARPGLGKVFGSDYEKVFKTGSWNEMHPFIQAGVAWTLIASDQEYLEGYLDPDIVRAVASSTMLVESARTVTDRRRVSERWKLTVEMLNELDRLGLGPDPQPEQEEDDSPGEGRPCEDGEKADDPEPGESDNSTSKPTPDADDEELDTDGADSEESDGSDGEPSTGSSDEDNDDGDSEAGGDDGEEGDEGDDEDATGNGGAEADPDGEEDDDGDASGDGDGDPSADSHPDDGDASSAGDGDEDGDPDGDSTDDGEPGDSDQDSPSLPAPSSGVASEAGFDDAGEYKPTDTLKDEEYDHEAGDKQVSTDAVVTLDPEVAAEAFAAMTGHEHFGDATHAAEALGETMATPPRQETELLTSTISFDGYLEGDKGNITEVVHKYRRRKGAPTQHAADFRLPTSIRVAAAQQMRLAFAANRKIGREHDLTSGRSVDARTMGYRIPTGDDRIFTRRNVPKKRDWTVLVGIDVSGSTSGAELDIEKAIAIGLGDLLTEVGIPFSMYAHTGDGSALGGFKLVIVPLKGEHEQWSQCRDDVADLTPNNINLDGHTMQAYRKLLDRQRGKDKLLIYFTDGAMPCANMVDERRVLISECARMRKAGTHLVGVGIGTDSPRQYGLDTIEVNGVHDIPKMILGIGQRLSIR